MSAGEAEFRPLEERERRLLERLLDHPFAGRDQLRQQLASVTARLVLEYKDNYGSIELHVADPTPATVQRRVPVEGQYPDEDGVPVWVLLHVKDGVLCELEICRADGQPLKWPPLPERLDVY